MVDHIRNDLCLSDKIKVIQKIDEGAMQEKIAKDFKISQSQVSRNYQRKQEYLSLVQANSDQNLKRISPSDLADVDEALFR